jgi:hypothetical protein
MILAPEWDVMISKIAVLPTMILSVSIVVAAERSAVIVDRDAFACTSWAAWHDYTLASLTPKGARVSKLCPIRLKPGTRVEVLEDDSGEGASFVRAAGKEWYVDAQRLSAK